jgi:peptide deformylase
VFEEGSTRGEEGCLSIPEVFGDVDRAARVIVRAIDRDGQPFEIEGADLLSRCLQHEIDHLHGKLFIDYLSILKRRAALAKWDEQKVKYPALTRTVVPVSVIADRHDSEEM